MNETPTENGFILLCMLCIDQTMPEKCIFQITPISLSFMIIMAHALFPISLLIYKYGRDLGRKLKKNCVAICLRFTFPVLLNSLWQISDSFQSQYVKRTCQRAVQVK